MTARIYIYIHKHTKIHIYMSFSINKYKYRTTNTRTGHNLQYIKRQALFKARHNLGWPRKGSQSHSIFPKVWKPDHHVRLYDVIKPKTLATRIEGILWDWLWGELWRLRPFQKGKFAAGNLMLLCNFHTTLARKLEQILSLNICHKCKKWVIKCLLCTFIALSQNCEYVKLGHTSQSI